MRPKLRENSAGAWHASYFLDGNLTEPVVSPRIAFATISG